MTDCSAAAKGRSRVGIEKGAEMLQVSFCLLIRKIQKQDKICLLRQNWNRNIDKQILHTLKSCRKSPFGEHPCDVRWAMGWIFPLHAA